MRGEDVDKGDDKRGHDELDETHLHGADHNRRPIHHGGDCQAFRLLAITLARKLLNNQIRPFGTNFKRLIWIRNVCAVQTDLQDKHARLLFREYVDVVFDSRAELPGVFPIHLEEQLQLGYLIEVLAHIRT